MMSVNLDRGETCITADLPAHARRLTEIAP
jgi:hypothetical protein